MSYSYIKEGGETKKYVSEFVADKIEDIDSLPTNVSIGSSCICLENSSIYILGSAGWQKF
jgi:hypothetical protein